MCFGDFLPMRTLCDVYHKEFESHLRSILDISCGRGAVVGGHKFRFRKLSIEVPVFHIVYFHIRELELLFTVPLCLNRASPSYNSHFL